jgi:hypothetical protein
MRGLAASAFVAALFVAAPAGVARTVAADSHFATVDAAAEAVRFAEARGPGDRDGRGPAGDSERRRAGDGGRDRGDRGRARDRWDDRWRERAERRRQAREERWERSLEWHQDPEWERQRGRGPDDLWGPDPWRRGRGDRPDRWSERDPRWDRDRWRDRPPPFRGDDFDARVVIEPDARRVLREAERAEPWSQLHEAAASIGDAGLIRAMMARGADANARDGRGRTPLHVAAMTGAPPDVIAALLAGGADVRARDAGGATPLHLVDAPESAGLLAASGADACATDAAGARAMTAFMLEAIRREAPDVYPAARTAFLDCM